MEKPLLTLKPNATNAAVPEVLKSFLYSLGIVVLLFGISSLLKRFDIIVLSTSKVIMLLIPILLVVAAIPLAIKLVILYNTNYHFFRGHLVSEFKFFRMKRHSLPYKQIVNIVIDISFWDRLCKAGDIVISTAEDKRPELTLRYIKDPMKVESAIYAMINKKVHK